MPADDLTHWGRDKLAANFLTFSHAFSWMTRTTRTPAFWGYPPPPNDYPYHWVKRRQSQNYKFKIFAKIINFLILKGALHATHLLKLLDKMCKYEMDPMSIVEDTERTRFCPQTDRRTDGQGDTSIPPFQLRWSGGYKNIWISIEISLKFVPKGLINSIPSLVQIMVWCRPGDKPLSEPMMVSLLTYICITQPQWVKTM